MLDEPTNLPPQAPASKTCNACGQEKPLTTDYFDRDASIASGFRGRCKACRQGQATKERARKRIERETGVEQHRRKAEANRKAILALIDNHRSEFSLLVQRYLAQEGESDQPRWIRLG